MREHLTHFWFGLKQLKMNHNVALCLLDAKIHFFWRILASLTACDNAPALLLHLVMLPLKWPKTNQWMSNNLYQARDLLRGEGQRLETWAYTLRELMTPTTTRDPIPDLRSGFPWHVSGTMLESWKVTGRHRRRCSCQNKIQHSHTKTWWLSSATRA